MRVESERPDPETMFTDQFVFIIRPLAQLGQEFHVLAGSDAEAKRAFHAQHPGWPGTILSCRQADEEVSEARREKMRAAVAEALVRFDEQQAIADSVTGGQDIVWEGEG